MRKFLIKPPPQPLDLQRIIALCPFPGSTGVLERQFFQHRLWKRLYVLNFFLPVLLRYTWLKALDEFKVCGIIMWHIFHEEIITISLASVYYLIHVQNHIDRIFPCDENSLGFILLTAFSSQQHSQSWLYLSCCINTSHSQDLFLEVKNLLVTFIQFPLLTFPLEEPQIWSPFLWVSLFLKYIDLQQYVISWI